MQLKSWVLASAVLAAAGATATPIIPADSVRCVQDPATKAVAVTYSLGTADNDESAIVTVDFETNATGRAEGPWVSIGARHFRDVGGDVNRLVTTGEVKTITWRPDKGWPNHVFDASRFRATVQAWTEADPPDYLVVILSQPYGKRYYTCEDALPLGIESDAYRRDRLVFRRIHAAGVTWRKGELAGATGRSQGALETARYVTLSKDYYLAVFPFTLWQYCYAQRMVPDCSDEDGAAALDTWSWNQARYGKTDGRAAGAKVWPEDKSVEKGSVIYALRDFHGLDFDYPTAAQWEYACRAGTSTQRFDGSACPQPWDRRWNTEDVDPTLDDYAWYAGNSDGRGHRRVGSKKANPWGLYDMYGLVYEFCLDWADESDATNSPVVDPLGPDTGTKRICCGGAYNCGVPFLRSAVRTSFAPQTRYLDDPILGFRLAAPLPEP